MRRHDGFRFFSLFVVSIYLSVVFLVPSIKGVEAPLVLWSKLYFHGEGRCVIQTMDGGYAVAGETDGKMVLIKTDAVGNVQWTRTYWNGTAYLILQTNDGGYVLAGSAIFFKTNSEGNVEWNTTLQCSLTGLGEGWRPFFTRFLSFGPAMGDICLQGIQAKKDTFMLTA